LKSAVFVAYVGVFTALTTVATIMIQIPVPQTRGYINLGDTMVMLSGLLLGASAGFIAGGLGSALADMATGYLHWAPFTLVIKGLEGAVIGFLARKGGWMAVLGTIIGGLLMVLGYFTVECFLYGLGGALVEAPGNVFQAVTGMLLANVAHKVISRIFKDVTGLNKG